MIVSFPVLHGSCAAAVVLGADDDPWMFTLLFFFASSLFFSWHDFFPLVVTGLEHGLIRLFPSGNLCEFIGAIFVGSSYQLICGLAALRPPFPCVIVLSQTVFL